ncbi:MAG: hypothetical protein DSY90_01735 [Deltaproteobacteria bacterium]|nr:MAG: hypothetical protein DSY90_01735 [Deltaproteobacteria bacterium]
MEIIYIVWKWANDNAGALGIVLVVIPLAWTVYTYLTIKKQDLKERRFIAYHKLIQQLVERENPDQPMRLDRQIAIVFELRNFEEYFDVTLRILRGLKESWADYGPKEKRNRLREELDESIRYIERKL